jgi:hypothetical protein
MRNPVEGRNGQETLSAALQAAQLSGAGQPELLLQPVGLRIHPDDATVVGEYEAEFLRTLGTQPPRRADRYVFSRWP